MNEKTEKIDTAGTLDGIQMELAAARGFMLTYAIAGEIRPDGTFPIKHKFIRHFFPPTELLPANEEHRRLIMQYLAGKSNVTAPEDGKANGGGNPRIRK